MAFAEMGVPQVFFYPFAIVMACGLAYADFVLGDVEDMGTDVLFRGTRRESCASVYMTVS